MPRKKKSDAKVKILSEEEQAFVVMEDLRRIAGEFFDHAVIMVSRTREGNTEFFHTKFGNDFAVKGMVDSYVNTMSGEFDDGDDEGSFEEEELN